jgi:hypothetical protein
LAVGPGQIADLLATPKSDTSLVESTTIGACWACGDPAATTDPAVTMSTPTADRITLALRPRWRPAVLVIGGIRVIDIGPPPS